MSDARFALSRKRTAKSEHDESLGLLNITTGYQPYRIPTEQDGAADSRSGPSTGRWRRGTGNSDRSRNSGPQTAVKKWRPEESLPAEMGRLRQEEGVHREKEFHLQEAAGRIIYQGEAVAEATARLQAQEAQAQFDQQQVWADLRQQEV